MSCVSPLLEDARYQKIPSEKRLIFRGHPPAKQIEKPPVDESLKEYANRFVKQSPVILTGSAVRPKPRPTPAPTIPNKTVEEDHEPDYISELIRSSVAPQATEDPYDCFFDDIKGWEEELSDDLVFKLATRSSSSYTYLTCTEGFRMEEPLYPLPPKRFRRKILVKKPEPADSGAEESSHPLNSGAEEDTEEKIVEEPPKETEPSRPRPATTLALSRKPSKPSFEETSPWHFSKEESFPEMDNDKFLEVITHREEPKKEMHRATSCIPRRDVFDLQSQPHQVSPASERMAVLRKKLIFSAASAKTHWRSAQSSSSESMNLAIVTGKKYCKLDGEPEEQTLLIKRPHTAAPLSTPKSTLPILVSSKHLHSTPQPISKKGLNPIIKGFSQPQRPYSRAIPPGNGPDSNQSFGIQEKIEKPWIQETPSVLIKPFEKMQLGYAKPSPVRRKRLSQLSFQAPVMSLLVAEHSKEIVMEEIKPSRSFREQIQRQRTG